MLILRFLLLGCAVPSSYVGPWDGVGSVLGVPLPAGGTIRRRMYLISFALLHAVCAPCGLLFYSVGRGVVPHPFVGLPYRLFYYFAPPVGPFDALPRGYLTCPEAFLPCSPFAIPFCCRPVSFL